MKRMIVAGAVALILWISPFGEVLAQRLAWVETQFGGAVLKIVETDGMPPIDVALDPHSLPEGMAIDRDGNIYWTELQFSGAKVLRREAATGVTSVLVDSMSALRGIAIDPAQQCLYWASSNLLDGACLWRAGAGGGVRETLLVLGAGSNPRGVAVDSTHLYWAEFDRGSIHRVSLTPGAVPEELLSGLDGPCGIAVDRTGGWFYWTEMNGNRIGRARPDGMSPIVVLPGLSRPNHIALGEGQIVWSELEPPRIRWAETTGWVIVSPAYPALLPGGLALNGRLTDAGPGDLPVPQGFALSQNFPNPFNGETEIHFSVLVTAHASLTVYDVLGRTVAKVFDGVAEAGRLHRVRFEADGVGSGVYFYRLESGGKSGVRKLMLTR